jgi:hypothetical protein
VKLKSNSFSWMVISEVTAIILIRY